jgi:hypothetical protein
MAKGRCAASRQTVGNRLSSHVSYMSDAVHREMSAYPPLPAERVDRGAPATGCPRGWDLSPGPAPAIYSG